MATLFWPGYLRVLLALLLLDQMVSAAHVSQIAKKQVQLQQQQREQQPQPPQQQQPQQAQQQQQTHPHGSSQQYVHEPEVLSDQHDIKDLGSEDDSMSMSDPYQMLNELKQEARLPTSSNYPWNPYTVGQGANMPSNPFAHAPPPVLPMPKMLPFIGYAQPVFIPFPLYLAPDMFYPTYPGTNNDLDDVVMSRAANGRRPSTTPAAGPGFQRNSPIYYVRLPPTPYMFVPNMAPNPFGSSFSPLLTYQPMPTFSSFGSVFNLPVNFLANGKPSGIYQMNGPTNDLSQFPGAAGLGGGFNTRPPIPSNPYRPTPNGSGSGGSFVPPPQGFGLASLPAPQHDSKLTSLKRPFLFNGRPEDIYILPNNFNPLYNEQTSYY